MGLPVSYIRQNPSFLPAVGRCGLSLSKPASLPAKPGTRAMLSSRFYGISARSNSPSLIIHGAGQRSPEYPNDWPSHSIQDCWRPCGPCRGVNIEALLHPFNQSCKSSPSFGIVPEGRCTRYLARALATLNNSARSQRRSE